jgi:hypothetical protein
MAAHPARHWAHTVWNRTAARAVEFATRHGAGLIEREAGIEIRG